MSRPEPGADGQQAVLESLKQSLEQTAPRPPARLADTLLKERAHVCAFFSSAEEEYEIVLPFIKEGLERGEKGFHAIDPDRVEDHLRRLTEANIDVEDYCRTKQLEIRNWHDVYLMSGTYDPAASGAVFNKLHTETHRDGYPNIRVITQMEWVTQHLQTLDDLLLVESRWNEQQAQFAPNQVVCLYDTRKFRADTIVDMMRTHAQIVIGRTVYENPFFVPFDEFRRELEDRAHRRTLIRR